MAEDHTADLGRQRILASRGLFVADPEAIEGLAPHVPDGSTPTTALQSYDTRTSTKRKVRCALCGRQIHHRGFVVRLDTGEVVLAGKNCGEEHFGHDAFARVFADLERRQEAAFYEARTPIVLEQLAKMAEPMRRWEKSIRGLSQFLTAVRTGFPVLWSLLRGAASNDGNLIVADTRQIAVAGRDGEMKEVRDFGQKVVGRIPFPDAFNGIAAAPLLREANDLLRSARETLEGSPGFVKRKAAFVAVNKARQKLVECERVPCGHPAPLGWLMVGNRSVMVC